MTWYETVSLSQPAHWKRERDRKKGGTVSRDIHFIYHLAKIYTFSDYVCCVGTYMVCAYLGTVCAWLHTCTSACFWVCEQGGGTQQHRRQPAAISCAWRSCQNELARPLSLRSAGHAFFHQRMEGWDLGGVFIHTDGQSHTKGGTVDL